MNAELGIKLDERMMEESFKSDYNLGKTLLKLNRLEEAEPLLRAAAARPARAGHEPGAGRAGGFSAPIYAVQGLALVARAQGRAAEAIAFIGRVSNQVDQHLIEHVSIGEHRKAGWVMGKGDLDVLLLQFFPDQGFKVAKIFGNDHLRFLWRWHP